MYVLDQFQRLFRKCNDVAEVDGGELRLNCKIYDINNALERFRGISKLNGI